MSDSVWPHRQQPTRLPNPWDSPGKNTGVGCHFLLQCMKVKSESEVTQSCPTLRDPMDCSLPGSSVHGISQARVLEWGACLLCQRLLGKCYYHLLINVVGTKSLDKLRNFSRQHGSLKVRLGMCTQVGLSTYSFPSPPSPSAPDGQDS